ncbi:hypothetical protein [Bradyrhizobium sp. MOS002]|uniref:hypothetical protein n=1 Tax=Bradyrhizobium sp. MOS002 TaxID=2133947 RepID=UPI001FE0EEF7|nr:hypothetical protein [Bradyrhizobium sp. MOS002]
MNLGFWLYVVRMPRQRTNSALDQYELAGDEIVTACDGDLRSALRALMLLNEQLEQELTLMSGVRPPDRRLHYSKMCLRIDMPITHPASSCSLTLSPADRRLIQKHARHRRVVAGIAVD